MFAYPLQMVPDHSPDPRAPCSKVTPLYPCSLLLPPPNVKYPTPHISRAHPHFHGLNPVCRKRMEGWGVYRVDTRPRWPPTMQRVGVEGNMRG
eukprot:763942-Hanusia_phi.AAC.2